MCIFLSLLDFLKNITFTLLYNQHELCSGQSSCAPNLTPSLLLPPEQCLGIPKAHLLKKEYIWDLWKISEKEKTLSQIILWLLCFTATRVEVILEVNKELSTIASYPFFPQQDPTRLYTSRSFCLAE